MKFLKSEFSKNVLKLISGTTVAQAIPVLISPILARLYNPQNFGDFALFTSFVSILAVMTTFRYEVAIVLPRLHKDAVNLFVLCFNSSLIISFISLLIILIFGDSILTYLGYENIIPFKFLLPISIFFAGLYQSSDYLLNRLKEYSKMSYLRIVQSLFIALLGLIFGYFSFGSLGLILSNIVGFFITILLILIFIYNIIVKFRDNVNLNKIKYLAKKYSSLFFFGTAAGFVSTFAQQSFFMLTSTYIGPVTLGYFYLIHRVVGIPSSVIGNSMGQVFYQSISRFETNQSHRKIIIFFKQILLQSLILHFLLFVSLSFLFVPIFGDQWSEASQYIIYFIIIGFFSFIFGPLSHLFNYFDLQKSNLFWQALWLVSNFVVFVLAYYYDISVHLTLIIFTIKQALLYTLGILFFLIYSKKISN